MTRHTRLLLLLTFFVAVAFPVSAQYGEQFDVRVIQVPVVVWRGAEPVTGLGKEDFELFVNGEARPVAYFDVLDFDESETLAPESARRSDQRRLTMLLFDSANTSRSHLVQARRELEKWVKRSTRDDYFAVATYDGSNVGYLAPFTGDRTAVIRALSTLQRSSSADPLALVVTGGEPMLPREIVPHVAVAEGDEGAGVDDLWSVHSASSCGFRARLHGVREGREAAAGHIRHAVVDNALLDVDGFAVRRRARRLETAALVDRNIYDDRAVAHAPACFPAYVSRSTERYWTTPCASMTPTRW